MKEQALEDRRRTTSGGVLARHSSLAQSTTEPVPKESRSTMSEPISRITSDSVSVISFKIL